VAELAYSVAGEEVGRVRSDGIVVATPAGSTGYNLANGGPVMAWGVEGFVVSFIAPHSLTARALVVAPDDQLRIQNRSVDPVELSIDGRPVAEVSPGEEITASFAPDMAVLALPEQSSFYRRLRDTFGRLSSS
jgi:NAD+ kinase